MNKQKLCPNCQATLHGAFCSNCGQNQKRTDRFLLSLINEAFEDIFRFDSRAWRTTYSLLFKPGFLSTEYMAGRRARYIPPLRLYVITSLAFFVSLSIINFVSDSGVVEVNDGSTADANHTAVGGNMAAQEPAVTAESGDVKKADEQSDPAAELNEELQFNELSVSFLGDEETEQLRVILQRQGMKLRKMLAEDPAEFGAILIDLAPPIMFILLPLFALLLKIAYLFRGMFYTEHLVTAVHNQCFLYLVLLIYSILPFVSGATFSGWAQFVTGSWIPIYLLLSLKNVYGQSWPLTTLKYLVLSASYMLLMFAGMATAVLVGLLTL